MTGNSILDVFLDSKLIAKISSSNDQLSWKYVEDWTKNGYEISPWLPLELQIPKLNVQRFLRNLLPEGNALDELSVCYNLSKSNTFAIIRALGLDIPGSIILLPPEQPLPEKGEFRKISVQELTKRLDDRDHFSLIVWDGKPRLSVAGIQDKINIVLDEHEALGFGEGRLCSTHILKFEKQKQVHLALNEYVTMKIASLCGLNVAETELKYFGKHAALLVKRFDRQFVSNSLVKRKHMIDGCQALNLPPEYKYERNFGSSRDVAHIRDGVSLPRLFAFAERCDNPALTKKKMLDWVLFNLLIFNFDAHGKKISFFVSREGMKLTPFYDLVNIKMYAEFDHEMAMALGDEFNSDQVNAYQLADFADSCQLPRSVVKSQLESLIDTCGSVLELDLVSSTKSDSEKMYIEKYITIVRDRCAHLRNELRDITNIEL